MFFGERATVWQETSALICSNINTIDMIGNLLLLCGFHFSSQGWAWGRSCLSRQHNVASPICENMNITNSIIWESILELFFYLKGVISLPSLSGSLFISFSFQLCFLSFDTFSYWVSVMNEHFSTLILLPHPLSWVRMIARGRGFSSRVSKYPGNRCINTQTHTYSHKTLEIVIHPLRYIFASFPHLGDKR